MARRILSIAILGIGFGVAGCVPADKYNAVKLELTQANERLAIEQAENSKLKEAADNWKSQLDLLMARGNDQSTENKSLRDQLAALQEQNGRLEENYKNAMNADRGTIVVNQPVLPQAQSDALKAFAAQYPDLLEYDAARGMIKFKADVTFATGSDALTPNAQKAINAFGKLLNSDTFRNYEFFVAGYTDSEPVRNPATIAAGHKDNWYLSAHRAISVAHDLISQGVSQSRVGVEGFADQRPVALNTTADGRAKNRRVEVMIMPATARPTIQTASNETPAPRRAITTPTPPRPAVNLQKDTVLDQRPLLNK